MTAATIASPPRELLAAADWPAIAAELDASGCALTSRLLTPEQCRDLSAPAAATPWAWSSTTLSRAVRPPGRCA
jgi:hypothetical protein